MYSAVNVIFSGHQVEELPALVSVPIDVKLYESRGYNQPVPIAFLKFR